jgi:type IV pilus assembly protein PilE
MKRKHQGLTLIELMIVVAIISILAAVAYPSYVSSLARANRSEALRELMRIANLQEQHYVDLRTYSADMTKLGLAADPFITESGNYSIDAVANASSFTLTATAKGAQATNDADCLTININHLGKKTAANASCWEQ